MNEKRTVVKFFYEHNCSPAEIFQLLKKYGFSRMFIHRTIKRLQDTGSINDRKRSGRSRKVRTKARIKAVREKIRRKRRRSQRKMASRKGPSRSTIQRIILEDLKLRPYKRRKVHGLTKQQRQKRYERAKLLLERHENGNMKNIVFSDEKLFVIEEQLNAQNDRFYAASIEDVPEEVRNVQRFQKPGSVMVWAAGANFHLSLSIPM